MKEAIQNKRSRLIRRKRRVRARVIGTQSRPRLAVTRSLHHVACQIIDDSIGRTLVSAHEQELKDVKGTKTVRAEAVGKLIAEKAKKQNITAVVFDRGGRLFHGRVKAVADGARAAGLSF